MKRGRFQCRIIEKPTAGAGDDHPSGTVVHAEPLRRGFLRARQ
jgi:hypothetical protein